MAWLPAVSALPGPVIIPFPLERRIGKVRRAAEVLSGKSRRAADVYWRQLLFGMAREMGRAGLSREAIESQLRDFHSAVQAELSLRATGNDQASEAH